MVDDDKARLAGVVLLLMGKKLNHRAVAAPLVEWFHFCRLLNARRLGSLEGNEKS